MELLAKILAHGVLFTPNAVFGSVRSVLDLIIYLVRVLPLMGYRVDGFFLGFIYNFAHICRTNSLIFNQVLALPALSC